MRVVSGVERSLVTPYPASSWRIKKTLLIQPEAELDPSIRSSQVIPWCDFPDHPGNLGG